MVFSASVATDVPPGDGSVCCNGRVPMNTTNPLTIGRQLYADHQRLEALFVDVLERLEHNDRDETAAAWNAFSRGLLAHIEMEETDILPAYGRVFPAEAAWVLVDHARFRAKLTELDVAVDLHFIRADVAKEFIDALRTHAERENDLMYAWADANASPRTTSLAARFA
jgi:hemerythrin-like domain-containing protein